MSDVGIVASWALMIALACSGLYQAIRMRPLPWHREGYACDEHCDERCNDVQERSGERRSDVLQVPETTFREAA